MVWGEGGVEVGEGLELGEERFCFHYYSRFNARLSARLFKRMQAECETRSCV